MKLCVKEALRTSNFPHFLRCQENTRFFTTRERALRDFFVRIFFSYPLLNFPFSIDAVGATHERCGDENSRFLLHAKKVFFL